MPDVDLNAEPYRTPALLGALTGRLRREGWPLVDQLDQLIDGLLERVDKLEFEREQERAEHAREMTEAGRDFRELERELAREHARAEEKSHVV